MKTIQLTRGKETIVDDDTYELIKNHNWHCSTTGYAIRNLPRVNKQMQKKMYLHRFIMQSPDTLVDHIDGDRLNNLRSNLRLADYAENRVNCKMSKNNTTGFRGVSKTAWGKYQAAIKFKDFNQRIGLFISPIEAAKAYDQKAKEFFGEFAKLNFPL